MWINYNKEVIFILKMPIPYTPKRPYCVMCGNTTDKDTCTLLCAKKLNILREAIRLRKSIEQMGITDYDQRTIRSYNRVQAMLKRK